MRQPRGEIVPFYFYRKIFPPDSYRYCALKKPGYEDLAGEIIELCPIKPAWKYYLLDCEGRPICGAPNRAYFKLGRPPEFSGAGQRESMDCRHRAAYSQRIVHKALHNSAELNKLRIAYHSITLEASDNKITHRRLLERSRRRAAPPERIFDQHGQSLLTTYQTNRNLV